MFKLMLHNQYQYIVFGDIEQLFEDPVAYVHDFIVKPGKMLSGRGSVTVYLNHMIFRVIEGKLMTSMF